MESILSCEEDDTLNTHFIDFHWGYDSTTALCMVDSQIVHSCMYICLSNDIIWPGSNSSAK